MEEALRLRSIEKVDMRKVALFVFVADRGLFASHAAFLPFAG